MPPSRGRYFAFAVFVFALTISPYAHAAETTAFGSNDPFAEVIQVWTAVIASIESLAHQIASAVQLHQGLTATPQAPINPQQPAALAAAAALATESPPETATTSGTASGIPGTPPKATSDQTTQSPFVKSPDFSPKSSAVSPTPATNFVTQDQFNAGLSALGISLRQLIAESAANPVVSGYGAPLSVEAFAPSQRIDQLNNVTITNPSITGLSAGDIPDLSGSYLSLGGGTLTGAFVDSGTASSSFAGALGIGTTSPSDVLAVNGPIFLGSASPAATADRLYNNGGSLYWAGSLIGGGSVGNWTTDGTNVWRTGGNVGVGTTSPSAALSVVGNGYLTGALTAASLQSDSNPSVTVNPTGNSSATLSTLSVQGTTNSSTTREYLVNIGLTSIKGVGVGTPNGDKVALYSGIEGASGTGDIWAFNPLVTEDSGSGSYDAQGIELDFNNNNADTGDSGLGSPVGYGLSITGAGSFLSTAAEAILGNKNGNIVNGGIWNRGIVIANDPVTQDSFQDLGDASTSIDVLGSHTYDAIFDGGGNVGIGTTSPGALLSANGNILGNGTLALTGTTGTSTIAFGQGFTIGGSQFVVQQGSGNVGIGTASPANALDVLGSGTNFTNIAVRNGSIQGLYAVRSNTSVDIGSVSNTNVRILANNAEIARFTPAGNFGIGTTTPGSLLSLNNIANFTTGTSTFYTSGGINLAAGCFAISGNCLGLGNISGTLAVNQGGTGTTTWQTNSIPYYNGTTFTENNANFNFNGTALTAPLLAASQGSGTSTIAFGQGFTIGGSQFVVQQGSGNVGIGTNSPQTKLHVLDNVAGVDSVLSLENTSTANAIKGVAEDFYAADTGGTRKRTADISSIGETSNFVDADLLFKTRTSNSVVERMRIMASGNVGIGTTSPDTLLAVGSATPSGNVAHFENSTGSCYINPTTTSLSCSSDARLKTNVTTLTASSGLDALMQLNPVTYNWKSESATTSPHTGFIAQQVQEIADVTSTFQQNLIAWLGNASNGITDFFAAHIHSQEDERKNSASVRPASHPSNSRRWSPPPISPAQAQAGQVVRLPRHGATAQPHHPLLILLQRLQCCR